MKIIKEYSLKTQNGSTLHLIRVTAKEGSNLIEKHNGKLLKEYSNPAHNSHFYVLEDKRVVHIPLGPEATLYEPYNAFLEHIEETNIQKKINSSLVKKLVRLPNNDEVEYTIIKGEELQKKRNAGTLIKKTYYQLPNGKILRDNNSSGDVFKNKTEFDKYQSYLAKQHDYIVRKSSGNYQGILTWNLRGINKLGTNTLDHIEDISLNLPSLINAPIKFFDFTVDNLFKIDKYLYKNIITYKFQSQVFLPLLAYLGLTYLKHNNGSWVMLYDELNDLWLPDIRQINGELKMMYHPISIILNPEESHGNYIPLKRVYLHTASNPI